MKQKIYDQTRFQRLLNLLLVLLFLFTFFFSGYAQERSLTGVVSDQSGAPLPGVTVLIKGTTTGTVTDINGKYALKVQGPNAVVSFAFVGYLRQEIVVGDQTSLNISLKEEVKELNEVVVIGYGVQKKSDLTGAVASGFC